MESQEVNRIILPFRHDAPTSVGSLTDLRHVAIERESADSRSRPYVVYGVPYAGKSTLAAKLRAADIVVLDTDDVVEYVLGRLISRYVSSLKDRMMKEPQVLIQQAMDYVLTHPGGQDPFHAWRAGMADLESVDACKHRAMDKVKALLSAEETYSNWMFTHSEGVAQVVFTNLTTLEWYDAGFFRKPSHARSHCGTRYHRRLTEDGASEFPAIGPSPETLAEWYFKSLDVATRVDAPIILEEDEWISLP